MCVFFLEIPPRSKKKENQENEINIHTALYRSKIQRTQAIQFEKSTDNVIRLNHVGTQGNQEIKKFNSNIGFCITLTLN